MRHALQELEQHAPYRNGGDGCRQNLGMPVDQLEEVVLAVAEDEGDALVLEDGFYVLD